MNSSELYELFRSDTVDTASAKFWSDDEVWRYMDDAYQQFIKLTGGVSDFTSDITQIPIVAGERVADYDKRILRIMSAKRASDGGKIEIANFTDTTTLKTTDYNITSSLVDDTRSGTVRFMVIGKQRGKCEWVLLPETDDTAQLHVYRKALTSITGDDQEFDDIDDDHHYALLHWMKHRAYAKQDADTFNMAKSEEEGGKFRAYCFDVKAQFEREKHKTRVVAYGGL